MFFADVQAIQGSEIYIQRCARQIPDPRVIHVEYPIKHDHGNPSSRLHSHYRRERSGLGLGAREALDVL